jgi:hypothetical protein
MGIEYLQNLKSQALCKGQSENEFLWCIMSITKVTVII